MFGCNKVGQIAEVLAVCLKWLHYMCKGDRRATVEKKNFKLFYSCSLFLQNTDNLITVCCSNEGVFKPKHATKKNPTWNDRQGAALYHWHTWLQSAAECLSFHVLWGYWADFPVTCSICRDGRWGGGKNPACVTQFSEAETCTDQRLSEGDMGPRLRSAVVIINQ